MGLADYKSGDGYSYKDCWHDDAESLIQVGILGFCGCGDPEGNLRYVLGGLRLIDEQCPESEAHGMWYPGHADRVRTYFVSAAAADFFYYWCDEKGLTEHGVGIPGWLTDEGHELLSLLEEWEREKGKG